MEQLTLSAQLRDKVGVRGALSGLRGRGNIPGVIYGLNQPPVAVMVIEKELLGVIKKGANAVLKLKYSGKEDNVILKEIQRHVVTDKLIHVDFHRISMTETIQVKVHIRITGEAFGVKTEGGLLEHGMRELSVQCLPVDIPKEIQVDVTNLKMGESLRVRDVKAGKAEILDDPNHIIVSVVMPKEEVIETPAAAAGAVAGAAEAEPELVGGKGKKEEGEEGAESEKGAAQAGAKPGQPAPAKPADKKAEPKK